MEHYIDDVVSRGENQKKVIQITNTEKKPDENAPRQSRARTQDQRKLSSKTFELPFPYGWRVMV